MLERPEKKKTSVEIREVIKINFKNVKPGMRIKNYKKLCELLEIDFPKGGTVKHKQLREIDCYMSYQKCGYTYIIKDVYDKKTIKLSPLKPRDKRYKNPRNIYTRYINQILLQILNDSPEKKLNNIAFKDICALLNLVEVDDNGKYIFKDTNGTFLKMTQKQRTLSIQKMVSILKSAISSLVNRRCITYQHSEREYTISLSSSINVINLTEEEFQREKQILHEEFIEFIKSNYIEKGETNDPSN